MSRGIPSGDGVVCLGYVIIECLGERGLSWPELS